jgi:ankyrin repeat protein
MNSQKSKAQNEKRFFVIATLVAFGIIAGSGGLRWRAQQAEWLRHDQAAQREAKRLAAKEAAEKRLALYHKFLDQKEQQRIAGIGVRTALIQAAENGNLPIVRQLLKEGYDPNYEEENDYGNDGPALEALVSRERYWGNSAERDKIMKDIRTIIRLLLRHGAKLKNEKGDSPVFHLALQGPDESPPERWIVLELLRNGADPNQKFGNAEDSYNTGTPLGSVGRLYGRRVERAQIMSDLLRFGARLEGRDWWGRTALLQVLDTWNNSDTNEAIWLLKRGANVNTRDRHRRTPLHVLFGATPENGMTTVEIDPSFVKDMLRRGANPNARDIKGRTPLHFAIESLKMASNHRPAFLACHAATRMLFKYGADANVPDNQGKTPLIYLMQGFDANAPRDVRLETAQLLFKHGADPNIGDKKGKTPLLVLLKQASQGKRPAYFTAMQKMAQLLLQNGANADVRAEEGTSALSLVPQKQQALRALLKRWGATE